MQAQESNSECLNPFKPDAGTAFGELMKQHGDRLYRFVLKRIGNPAEAEDIAQQAICEALRTYDSFRGESQLSTWVYGIAANLVRNHLSRAPSRVYRFEEESVLEDVQADAKCPREQLEMAQLVRLLEASLGDLLPDVLQVLLMVSLDELSYQEAADQLGLPIGTVRSRVSRARAQLRRAFIEGGATC